jgi:dimethylargininase
LNFTHAIVRPPAANFAEGLTTAGLGKPDYARALQQHEAYCRALEQSGLALIRLAPDPEHPDSCFVEDTAILTTGGRAGDTRAILTRPGAPSRQGEIEALRNTLNDLFPHQPIMEIESPGTVDGGDICQARDYFFIGLSERTNEAGARQLSEALAMSGYRATMVSTAGLEGVLHLKSGMAYLGDNRLVVIEAIANREEFAGYELVTVPAGDEYAANCVHINNHVLIAAGYPAFETQLNGLGYRTIALDMSEFQKMDGGLSCLSLRFS